MTKNESSHSVSSGYHNIHLTPEDLAHLSPDELLTACLEYRNLLEIIMGVLTTPEKRLTVRAVAVDLIYSQAMRTSKDQTPGEATPAVYDIKAVSQRLGISPAEVRTAYEQLAEVGGVRILDRQYPRRRQQQLSLPLDQNDQNTTDQESR
jgi:hypothetical protein